MSTSNEATTTTTTAACGGNNHEESHGSSRSAALTPSQTIRGGNSNNRSSQNRNGRRTADPKAREDAAAMTSQRQEKNDGPPPPSSTKKKRNPPKSRQRKRNHNNGNEKTQTADATINNSNDTSSDAPLRDDGRPVTAKTGQRRDDKKKDTATKNRRPRRSKNNNKNKNNRNKAAAVDDRRYPWRRHIPEHSVDPITLEPLDELVYPPFALAAHEPYEPVPVWPVPSSEHDDDVAADGERTAREEEEEERQRRILREQWGQALRLGDEDDDNDKTATTTARPQRLRHYNLYDGRALAYYMVQQLQFIDPLNRRDVTRAELVNLDAYLSRHGFARPALNVTEAYDARGGVTLSTAGGAAHTAEGRARLLQERAHVLLRALFHGSSVGAMMRNDATTARDDDDDDDDDNPLALQYQAYQQQQESSTRQSTALQQHPSSDNNNHSEPRSVDHGIYGDDDGGILVIDDDMNPGLRGDAPSFTPQQDGGGDNNHNQHSGSLWSARHLTTRHNHAARLQAQEFPSLAATASTRREPSTTASQPPQQRQAPPPPPPKRNLPKAATLAKISGVVQPTTQEQKQKQWEARETMKRKAALSNLTFGANVALNNGTANPLQSAATEQQQQQQPTEAQVERNKALADALGVMPATLRQQQQQSINAGWARPTDPLAEFGEELQATIYPDAIILQARERMPLVLKMEKKWKTFLEDDTARSLPLAPMDRANRTFVHHYSDFWHLQTESYDPEPRRYIQCSKTRDTVAPHPLLSTAVRNRTGPPRVTPLPTAPLAVRDVPDVPPPPRQPLPLRPPSAAAAAASGGGAVGAASTLSGARPLTEGEKASDRFDGLASQQRPKLQLQPRTTPLDLPQAESSFDAREALRAQQERVREKARQDEAVSEAKRRALEMAFASDSEGDADDDDRSADSDDSDEWVEQEPLYQGDDEE